MDFRRESKLKVGEPTAACVKLRNDLKNCCCVNDLPAQLLNSPLKASAARSNQRLFRAGPAH